MCVCTCVRVWVCVCVCVWGGGQVGGVVYSFLLSEWPRTSEAELRQRPLPERKRVNTQRPRQLMWTSAASWLNLFVSVRWRDCSVSSGLHRNRFEQKKNKKNPQPAQVFFALRYYWALLTCLHLVPGIVSFPHHATETGTEKKERKKEREREREGERKGTDWGL